MLEYSIRRARENDIPRILELTGRYAFESQGESSTGTLIPLERRYVELLVDSGRFYLATLDNGDNNQVIGCASLVQRNSGAELRSLVVEEQYRGNGIGSKLVNCVIAEAYEMSNEIDNELFLLARDPSIFVKAGFEIVSEGNFIDNAYTWPEKVQADCADCPIKQVCPETLLVYRIPRELQRVYL